MSDERAVSSAKGVEASGLQLQDVILKLQQFWASRGCLLLPACDFAIPFAASHPDAFFGVLAPGRWRAVFVQPVRRPLDGRYGEHPYRLGKHLQLQVVLKPAPPDVQGLYLQSLEALGLELALHDLRFADWSWSPRSLGGRGSGWHALLDGLGVTRLTFLDRLAERDLSPPHVEIAYGVERLAMTLQGAESAFQLGWSQDGVDYGRLRSRDEDELTRYAFDIADPEALARRLEVLGNETERCLAEGLARAAYELAVSCLEPIDLLEARGELSARERADRLDRVRRWVVAAAQIADGQREAEEPPAAERQTTEGRATERQTTERQTKRQATKRQTARAAGKSPAGDAKKPKRRRKQRRARTEPDAEAPDGGASDEGASGE